MKFSKFTLEIILGVQLILGAVFAAVGDFGMESPATSEVKCNVKADNEQSTDAQTIHMNQQSQCENNVSAAVK